MCASENGEKLRLFTVYSPSSNLDLLMNSSIFHCFSKKDEMRVAAVAKWRLDCVAINYVGGEQKKPINTMIFVLVCDSIEFRVTILAVFLKIGFSVRHGLLFPYCAEEQFSIKKWGDGGGYVFTRNLTTYRNREKCWAQLLLWGRKAIGHKENVIRSIVTSFSVILGHPLS